MKLVFAILVVGAVAGAALGQAPQNRSLSKSTPAFTREQLEVLSVEDQYRQARLRGDLKALDRVLSDDYSGTNQNLNTRNKSETKDLFKTFKIKSLSIEKPQVVVHGDTAVVSGFQTEVIPERPEPARLRFVRVYIRQDGIWQLLASQQMTAPAD